MAKRRSANKGRERRKEKVMILFKERYVEHNGSETEDVDQPTWDLVKRTMDALERLGFKKGGWLHVECAHGEHENQMEGGFSGQRMTIDLEAILVLEGRAREVSALKENALAKLTPREKAALGL